jgi:serine/threonine protein kinase
LVSLLEIRQAGSRRLPLPCTRVNKPLQPFSNGGVPSAEKVRHTCADRIRPMDRTVLGDRYTLIKVLGSGGMAQVYLARDKVLERDVALKVLREQYADDEEFVERFRREAKNAASLNHPNVVQIYDQGRAKDGTYYIAMEHVPGGTLKERIAAEGALAPAEAAEIASQVAEALSIAHGRGIVHRDIKPQNVLLTASGEAKVADFGIARAVSATTMTQTNHLLGTAAYMSPEQVRGERVGPSSDLYSLGVVLYEMLTGVLLHEADDPIATAMRHLESPAPHPRDANPAVSKALDAVTVKLLSKYPRDRYPDAAELAEDLRRIRDGLSPLAAEAGEQPTVPVAGRTHEETRTAPTMVAPRRAVPQAGNGRGLRRISLPLLALLIGLALLGSLAWALLQEPSQRSAGDAERDTGRTVRIEVPDVGGLSPLEAQERLESVNLKLGSQLEASSDKSADGLVIEQNPAAGTEAGRGSAVDVTVGTGPTVRFDKTVSSSTPPTSSPSASPSASPAGDEGQGEAAEEAAKQREKAREEAQKRAEERRKAREEAREERQKAREEARKEANE